MKYLKNRLLIAAFFSLSIVSCSPSKNIEVSKSTSSQSGPQTLIYSLPKTRLDISVSVTKVTTIAGPYAAYAQKFLNISGAPVTDSEVYEISGVKINPVNEPDPDQFYSVNFKSYPSNLDKLFTMTQHGLMLNLENSWNSLNREFPSKHQGSGIAFERSIYDPVITEDVDTLYKTILTDASFVKVPIYKKSLEIKNEEDKAQDMANLILKLRKRKLKLMMGEYEYHPDGAALKVINEELGKQEQELMSHFIGKKITETKTYEYTLTPSGTVSKEILWFSEEAGISDAPKSGLNAISATVTIKENGSQAAEMKEKVTNNIYFRAPVMTQVSVKLGSTVLAEAKVPVYQAGKIQQLPVMP